MDALTGGRVLRTRASSIAGVAVLLAIIVAAAPSTHGDELTTTLERIAAGARGRVGVGARVIGTGTWVGVRADEPFPMQSVYKLPIAMAVLRAVDAGRLSLEAPVAVTPADFVGRTQHSPLRDEHPDGTSLPLSDILRLNVAESDGTACDVLLRLVGGPGEVMAYLGGLGITGVIVANSEKEMGAKHRLQYVNSATPRAAVALLEALHEGAGLSSSSRALLRRLLEESRTGPRRLKGGLPPGTVVAHKTGTSWTEDGVTAATNDIGLVTLPDGRRLAVAVFVSDARGDQAAREAVIAGVAGALWDAWGPRP